MLVGKQRTQIYEDKIKELHADVEAEARELGKVSSQLDNARRELIKVEIQERETRQRILVLESKIPGLEEKVKTESINHTNLVVEQGTKVSVHESEVRNLKASIEDIKKELIPLEERKKELDETITKLTSAKKELETFEAMIVSAKGFLDEIHKEHDGKLLEISTKKSEVEDLIKKNGKILSDTEQNLNRIRIYAKRLQKFYDKNGIKFDVLKSFNVNDNEDNL